ncbi:MULTISPECIES: sensor histidine kinase [Ralstonia]|uniref:histidine kinase n=4 Tax=Ralstonia TaxID=48736 RepID=A0ABN9J1V5_9RALS|nr:MULTISPECIES: sensor histidine kinase [Ralstonia]OYU21173.1 MAG: sensor histidine kinase [Ralstonia sp. PBBBR1]ENZ75985.1 signal transduction histidine kinase [Ralstonia pickettii OR214]MBB0026182.1 sensor histidine kinase [Ralstonia pickettii]MBB0036970.1 sensor histidine kinase [Ralstonia pickettii]MBB0099510.1 sensor histidine kinase [Ralstonia pickettii]
MSDPGSNPRIFLSTVLPRPNQQRLVTAVMLASVVVFVAVLPFAQWQLAPVWGFIPVYESAVVINDLVTAAMLVGQFTLLRSPGLLALSSGYFFTATVAAVHMLSFPGLFSASGLLGAGPQTTAWLYMFWHGGFPLSLIGYALLQENERIRRIRLSRAVSPVLWAAGAVLLLAYGLTALATHPSLLPAIMRGNGYTGAMSTTVSIVWMLNVLAAAILWRHRGHSLLNLWCTVVAVTSAFEVALSAVFNHGRFDLGFYAGRAYGLVASGFVLVGLIIEHARLYAMLVKALDNESAARAGALEKTQQLNAANEHLEQRVKDRTAQLSATNSELRQEITERKRAEQALERSREELRELAAISSRAREEERRRLSRELHDELAQSLAALKVDMQMLEHKLDATNAPVAERLSAMEHAVDDMIRATRRLASDLRPSMLDDLGLVPACRWLVESFQRRHRIHCELKIVPGHLELPEPFASTVYRVLQECLANVARHAGASAVHVRLLYEASIVQLSVQDDGIGFDPAHPRKDLSFGLVGLRERAYLVRGSLSIESSPESGTLIELTIPQTMVTSPQLPLPAPGAEPKAM